MSCSYYLRDKRITNKEVEKLNQLENKVNEKLLELYEEINKEVESILPIWDENIIEECRQYEPSYECNKFLINEINDFEFGQFVGGKFRFSKFSNVNGFIDFYNEICDKYIIIDEYREEYTLEQFLKKVHII